MPSYPSDVLSYTWQLSFSSGAGSWIDPRGRHPSLQQTICPYLKHLSFSRVLLFVESGTQVYFFVWSFQEIAPEFHNSAIYSVQLQILKTLSLSLKTLPICYEDIQPFHVVVGNPDKLCEPFQRNIHFCILSLKKVFQDLFCILNSRLYLILLLFLSIKPSFSSQFKFSHFKKACFQIFVFFLLIIDLRFNRFLSLMICFTILNNCVVLCCVFIKSTYFSTLCTVFSVLYSLIKAV